MSMDVDARCRRYRCTVLLGAWLACLGSLLWGSTAEAKRPFRTEDNETVPLGSLALELFADAAFAGSDRSVVFPGLSLKAGVADRVELGVEGGYQFVRLDGVDEAGLTETRLKVKVRFYDGAGAVPAIGATLGMILPTADRDIAPSRDLGFLALAQLTGNLPGLAYFANVGMTLTEDPQEQRNRLDEQLLWGLAFEIPLHAAASLALDFFGATQPGNGVVQSGLLGGIWRSPRQIDVDFAVIVGLTPSADDVGLTLGLTYQFPVFGGERTSQRQRPFAAKMERGRPAAPATDRVASGGRGRPLRRP
jgi:hypothetical protein